MSKDIILDQLIRGLEKLVDMLELDPRGKWTEHFRHSLEWARELKQTGYSTDSIAMLSKSITSVFQGMGSFNDYAPDVYDPETGRYTPIPGTEDFENITNSIFDLAIKLREKEK